MIGAVSIMFYGVWLIAAPDNSDIVGLEMTPHLRRRYHIRVLVPTYSEPLAIVQRTVLAARRAIVPEGCEVTIYLCDDGKQQEKRRFCDSLNASSGPQARPDFNRHARHMMCMLVPLPAPCHVLVNGAL